MFQTASTGTHTCFLTAVGRRWSLELRKPGPYAQDLNGLSVSSRSSRGALCFARRPTSMGKKLQTMLDHRSAYSSTTGIPNDDGEKSKHAAKFDAMLATVKGLGMVNPRLSCASFSAALLAPLFMRSCSHMPSPLHGLHSLKMRLRLSSCLLHSLPCCRIIFPLIARLLSPPSPPLPPPRVCARG